MKNRIYFFTGTGNSFWIAKELSNLLPDTELVAIKRGMDMVIPECLERVGFVYPTYAFASPLIVADFFRNAQFPKQKRTYYFAITTCGGFAVNAIPQANELLAANGIHLNYGISIRMFSNSIMNYNMSKKWDKITLQSANRALSIFTDVKKKRQTRIRASIPYLYKLHLEFMKDMPEKAKDFDVSNHCISCGLCASLCPAKNITMLDGKPEFSNHCEGCVSCIQHCPKKAINYKNKTNKRRRYSHPAVNPSEIIKYY